MTTIHFLGSFSRFTAASIVLTSAIIAVALFSASQAQAAGLSDPSALTKHDGGMTVTQDGAVIENLEIHGTLRIEANNVVVRNVWVYGSEFWSVYVASGSARIENSEIGHPSFPGSRGVGGNNVVGVGLNIHHVEDGIKLGSNSTYSGVNVHDLASPSSSPHSDAVQVESGSKNSTVKNSVLSSTGAGLGNSAVIVKSDLGHPSNISFVNNYMNGGNYTIFVRDGGHGVPSNISFVGNRFGTSRRYGLASLDGAVNWENNTWAETGELIDTAGNVIGSNPTTTTTAAPAPAPAPQPKPTTTVAPAPPEPAPTTTVAPAPIVTSTTSSTTTTLVPETTTTTLDTAALSAAEPLDPPPGSGANPARLFVVLGGLAAIAVVGFATGTYLDRKGGV